MDPSHKHAHPQKWSSDSALFWGFGLTLGFAAVEAAGGWLAGSLALLGDAGHMISDATALGLAAFAAWVARQPASARHSYGLVRSEAVAALFNGLFMLAVVAAITFHAVERLQAPQPVSGGTVMAVAALGLVINLAVAYLLHGGESNLNTRAALLHVMGDILGSLAALVAGVVIFFTGWTPIDPLLSLLICALILYSSVRLLRDVVHVIMEGVPPYLDLPEVGTSMAAVDGVSEVHDLHIWTLASGRVALSAHIVLRDMDQWSRVLQSLQQLLSERYGIEHVTLQPETGIQVATLYHIRDDR